MLVPIGGIYLEVGKSHQRIWAGKVVGNTVVVFFSKGQNTEPGFLYLRNKKIALFFFKQCTAYIALLMRAGARSNITLLPMLRVTLLSTGGYLAKLFFPRVSPVTIAMNTLDQKLSRQ